MNNQVLNDVQKEEFLYLCGEGVVCIECRRISWVDDETYDCGRDLCCSCCPRNLGEHCEKCVNNKH